MIDQGLAGITVVDEAMVEARLFERDRSAARRLARRARSAWPLRAAAAARMSAW